MRRRLARLVVGGLALAVVAVAGLFAWLRFDDPVPRFAARRGTLVAGRVGEVVSRDSGHLVHAAHVTSTSGLAVDMLVKRPLSGRPGPLVVILGGHNDSRAAARLIPDTRGRVVVALNYPYHGPHKLKGVRVLPWIPDIRRALHDTPPAVQLALDWLVRQPWVDARQVDAVGASLGTPFMTVVAAIDPRVTRLWSVHGAGETRTLLAHNARGQVPAPLLPLAGLLADILVAGPHLTPEKWVARVSPRPFVMINATEDERLPRPAILTLHDAAREPKRLVWLPGPHVQRNRPEVIRGLVTTVLGMMEGDDGAASRVAAQAR